MVTILSLALIAVLISAFILFLRLKKSDKTKIEIENKYISLSKDLESNINYAKEIASGNYDAINNLSEGDLLGLSLMEMSKNLKEADEEDRNRNWAISGVARLGEIIRTSNHNMEELANQLISYLVKYLNANQGGIFVLDDTNKADPFLEMKGCFAYDRKKYVDKKLPVNDGGGLLGQAVKENDTIYLTDIPDDYLHITSGLGESNPNAVIIVPLKIEEMVVGALEIASFNEFKPFEIEFLEKASESIASSIIMSKNNDNMTRLLRDSQELTEQLNAQSEEMRQNMEELQATQEDLERKQKDMERAEIELVESQKYLNTIIDSIPTPVFVKDKQHRFVLTNEAFSKIIGKDKQEILNKNDYDIFSREQAQLFWKKDEDMFNTDNSTLHKEEEILIDANGNQKTIITYKFPFRNAKGDQFMVATLVDITERVALETELSKERYLMEALMKNTTDYIYFKDLESRFIKVSHNMAINFGMESIYQILGKSDFDFFTDDHARPAYEQEQEIIKTGVPVINLIEKETWEDGRVTYVSTTKMPLRNDDGVTVGTFGTSRDITSSKKTENELIQKEQLYRLLIQNSSDVNTILDPDGHIRFQSPAYYRLFGFEESEIENKTIFDVIHTDDTSKLKDVLVTTKGEVGKKILSSIRYKKKSGEYVKMDVIIQNLIDNEAVNGIIIYANGANLN